MKVCGLLCPTQCQIGGPGVQQAKAPWHHRPGRGSESPSGGWSSPGDSRLGVLGVHQASVLSHRQGGTDVEKHRDLLVAENERLRREMKACEGELQELRRQQQVPCQDCTHLQVSQRWWQWW